MTHINDDINDIKNTAIEIRLFCSKSDMCFFSFVLEVQANS